MKLKGIHNTWTQIERVKPKAKLVIESIIDSILKSVDVDDHKACRAAFSETDTLEVLYKRIIDRTPRNVVETGSFLGLSTLVMAAALKQNHKRTGIHGKVYTISLNSFYRVARPLSKAKAAARRLDLLNYVHFIEGSSVAFSEMYSGNKNLDYERNEYLEQLKSEDRENLLYKLTATLKEVDFAFLDSLHYESFMMTELAALLQSSRQGGSILIDDALISNRKMDWKYFFLSLLHLDIHLFRIIDFIRCGFRFFYTPWVVDAFRWSHLARVRFFKGRKGFLRAVEIIPSPGYSHHYATLSTWRSDQGLKGFLKKYELKTSGSERIST